MISKNIAVTSGLLMTLVLSGCATTNQTNCTKTPISVTQKAYLGLLSNESSAFENFLHSPMTEQSKLNYLLDRILESQGLIYVYEGNKYGSSEAYAAGTWIVWRRYKKGENARTFLKREIGCVPNRSSYILLAEGLKHPAYKVFLNELDRLEEVWKQRFNLTLKPS